MLEGTIRALYSKENFPQYFSVADLGCSSGPNTLIVTYEMIDARSEERRVGKEC